MKNSYEVFLCCDDNYVTDVIDDCLSMQIQENMFLSVAAHC